MSAVLQRRPRTDRPASVRALAVVALGYPLLGVALLAAAVLVSVVALGGDPGDAGAVVAGLWLGAHQVPLVIDGVPLGVLPLLPTLLVVAVTARSVAAARPGARAPATVVAVLGPAALAAAAVAVVGTASVPLAAPGWVPAVVGVSVVHAVGAALGCFRAFGDVRVRLPPWVGTGLRAGSGVLVVLLAGGGVLVSVSLALSWSTVAQGFGPGAGAGAQLGLLALSVGYLPNVVVGATSVAVGPGAVLGGNTVTAFGATAAPVPGVPVLAAMPAGGGAWWWALVLVLPVAAAGWLGRRCARDTADMTDALRSVVTGAIGVGVALGLLGFVAGGRLGTGSFTPVGVPVPALVVATTGWLLVVGGVSVVLAVRRSRTTVAEVGG